VGPPRGRVVVRVRHVQLFLDHIRRVRGVLGLVHLPGGRLGTGWCGRCSLREIWWVDLRVNSRHCGWWRPGVVAWRPLRGGGGGARHPPVGGDGPAAVGR
jgi:hypothetical protein